MIFRIVMIVYKIHCYCFKSIYVETSKPTYNGHAILGNKSIYRETEPSKYTVVHIWI